ncbi:hypothetical protein LG3211_3204 [Lysobacter gummosus]|nr:hypothetical protein LG3211_3204 [Lysobacter gummosus]
MKTFRRKRADFDVCDAMTVMRPACVRFPSGTCRAKRPSRMRGPRAMRPWYARRVSNVRPEISMTTAHVMRRRNTFVSASNCAGEFGAINERTFGF